MSNPQVTAIISAEDKASAVLKAVAKLAQETAKQIEKGQADHLSAIPKHFDAATAAAEKHLATLSRIKDAFAGLATAAAAYAAIKLPQMAAGAFHAGEHLQHEELQLRYAGIPQAELDAARKQVFELTKDLPNVSLASGLETYKEARSVLLHPEETKDLLPTLLKAKSVLDASDPSGRLSSGLGFLVKGAEVAGIAQSPERFMSFMDAAVRRIEVMGKTINPEQLFELLKFEKSSAATLSDHFQQGAAISLTQELGGQTTGQAIDQFVKQIIGGFQGNLHAAAKEFVALGLANADDFERTKTGSIKGMKHGHKVKGADLAQTDPDKWVHDFLVPALEAHGFNDLQAQIGEVRRLFPAGRAADLVSKLISQWENIQNHTKLADQAQGLNTDPFKDASASLAAFTQSVEDFGAVVTEPILQPLAEGAHWLAQEVRGFSAIYDQLARQNPIFAAILGGTGLAAVSGGGLKAGQWALKNILGTVALDKSALALDGAAVALRGAAAALGAKGGLPNVLPGNVAGAAEGAAAAEGVAAVEGLEIAAETISIASVGEIALAAGAAGVLGVFLYNAIKDAWTHTSDILNHKGGGLPDDIATFNRDQHDTEKFGFTVSARIDELNKQLAAEGDSAKALQKLIDSWAKNPNAGPAMAPFKAKLDALQTQIEAEQKELDRLHKIQAGEASVNGVPLPPVRPKDLDAARPPQKLDVQTNVQGKVEGEAMLTVKMDPSPLFLAKIEGSLRSIPLSGKLSGKSMSGDTGLGDIGSGNHFAPTMSGF